MRTTRSFRWRSGGKRITAKERRQSEQKGKALDRALRSLIKCSPEGYRQAIKFLKGPLHRSSQNEFAELCHKEALPHLVTLDPSIWGNSPHAFDGFGNVRSRVNYLVPRHSPIASRIPLNLRPRITHRELIQGLRKLKPELEETSAGGKHPTKLKAPGGRAIPIPTHPRDMSTDTIRKIIRQAGLDMGIRQFLDSI